MGLAASFTGRTRSVRFTSDTSWTVPPGVFFIQVEAVGGGAGRARNSDGAAGSNTTVVVSGKTIVGPGCAVAPIGPDRINRMLFGSWTGKGTGRSGFVTFMADESSSDHGWWGEAAGQVGSGKTLPGYIDGAPTTPGASVSVTIGSGGSSSGNGDSGYVVITYEV